MDERGVVAEVLRTPHNGQRVPPHGVEARAEVRLTRTSRRRLQEIAPRDAAPERVEDAEGRDVRPFGRKLPHDEREVPPAQKLEFHII